MRRASPPARAREGDILTTLGAAYYRAGHDEKAVATLGQAGGIRLSEGPGATPAGLAFLAMAQRRLGRPQEARASLDRLRESLKDPRRAQDTEAQAFLREAESVVADARAPAGR